MTKTRTKQKIFWLSILSMILCLAMLAGATFAWFTAADVSPGNRVQTGGLGVRLLKHEGTAYRDISNGTGDIFGGTTLWEPGRTEIVFLQVQNYRTLPLNYNVLVEVADTATQTAAVSDADSEPTMLLAGEPEPVGLEGALEYAVIPGVTAEDYGSKSLQNWQSIIEAYHLEHSVQLIGEVSDTGNGALEAGDSEYFAVAVHMKEDAGNEFNQGQRISLDISIVAQQTSAGSFASEYFDVLCGLGNFENQTASDRYWTHFQQEGDAALVPAEAYVTEDDNTFLRISNHYWTHFRQCTSSEYTQYLEQDSEYFLSMKVRALEPDKTTPQILFVSVMDSGNKWQYYDVTDYVDELKANEWTEVLIPIPEEYSNMSSFRYGLGTSVKGGTRTAVDYDDVQLLKLVKYDSTQTMADEWTAKLAEEKAASQMVEEIVDLNTWKDPLPGAENLIKNGAFASDLSEWEAFNDNHIENAQWIADGSAEGTGGAIRMQKKDEASNPMWSQRIQVEGGCEYQISFYYRLPEDFAPLTARAPKVWLEYYTPAEIAGGNTWIQGTGAGPSASERIADGEWHFYHTRIQLPANAGSIVVSPRLLDADGSYMDIDEIVIYKTSSGDAFTLDTDGIFFYTDQEETTLSMQVNTAEFADYAKGYVVYELYDGEQAIWKSDEISYTDGVAETPLDLSLLYEKDHAFCVKATAYAEDGTQLRTITKELFKYDRPEYLSADGRYIKFGDDFDPIIGYHVYAEADKTKIAEAGINVIQLGARTNAEAVLKQLDDCAELGLKGLVCLYPGMKPAGDSANVKATIDIVSDPRIQNHEALFAYNIMDEPGIHSAEVHQALQDSYRLIRQYDQKNIITLMECFGTMYEQSAEYVDILYIDNYTAAKGGGVYSGVAKAIEDSGENKTVWQLGETYIRTGFSWLNTADDARNNNWQALIAGAGNIGYYSISDCGCQMLPAEEKETEEFKSKYPDGYIAIWETPFKDDPQHGAKLWAGLVEFAEKEKELAYDHFVHREGTRLVTDANLDADYIYASWATEDNKVYAVVLNVKGDDNTVTVPLKKADGSDMGAFTAHVVAGREPSEQTVYTGNGSLTVDMTGVEAILFEIQE